MRGLRLALALALASGLSAPATAQEPRRFAIVVGSNRGALTEQPLLFAEDDADRFAGVLTELASVNEEDVVVLHGASPERLRRVVDTVSARAATAGPGSLLFFYYSGHADPSSLHLGTERLGFDELTAQLAQVPVDVRVLVVDACRSGELTRVKGAVPAEPFEITARDALESEGTAIITSSSAGEDAQESDRLRGGVFTHHFVSGLLGAADASGDGRITLTEAYRYGYAQTIRATSQARFVQHPTYAFELRGKDDIVITQLKSGVRTGSLLFEEGGEFVVFEARHGGDLVAEAQLPDDGQMALPAGLYLVRQRTSSTVSEGEFAVEVGQTHIVRADALSTLPYGETVRKGAALERHSAWSAGATTAIAGPLLAQQSLQGRAGLGLRVDAVQASFQARILWSQNLADDASGTEQALPVHQSVLGLDGTVLKIFDGRVLSPGVGVRLGLDAVQQRFDTSGEAPARRALIARGGSVLRAERALSPRTLVGLEAGADFIAFRGQGAGEGEVQLQSRVIPTLGLEVSRYAR